MTPHLQTGNTLNHPCNVSKNGSSYIIATIAYNHFLILIKFKLLAWVEDEPNSNPHYLILSNPFLHPTNTTKCLT